VAWLTLSLYLGCPAQLTDNHQRQFPFSTAFLTDHSCTHTVRHRYTRPLLPPLAKFKQFESV
jgi:hypothetical protein